MLEILDILLKTKGNWPDINFTNSTLLTVDRLVSKLYKTAKENKLWWYPPSIGRDYDGSVSLDWSHNSKKYSLFVLEDEINYIAYWGNKTDEEREYGDINIENNLLDFWSWIADG